MTAVTNLWGIGDDIESMNASDLRITGLTDLNVLSAEKHKERMRQRVQAGQAGGPFPFTPREK